MRIADRCDQCGAQAFIHLAHGYTGHDLLFCGHHYSKYELALISQNFRVIEDARSTINLQASQSSA